MTYAEALRAYRRNCRRKGLKPCREALALAYLDRYRGNPSRAWHSASVDAWNRARVARMDGRIADARAWLRDARHFNRLQIARLN